MNTEMMRIRVPQPMKAWLDTRAKENGRSMNAELVDLLKPVMLAEPLEIFISECTSSLGVFFTVSVGQHGDDFHEGTDREAAYKAAIAKAKELGLPMTAIRLTAEDFNH